MWDWVGGRFSLWSSVGLSICCAVGYSNFEDLLKGAHEMDLHFKNEEFTNNIPVLMGLISIWYNNFYNCETEASNSLQSIFRKICSIPSTSCYGK